MTRHPGNGHAPLISSPPQAPVIVAELSDRAPALVHPSQVDHFWGMPFLEATVFLLGENANCNRPRPDRLMRGMWAGKHQHLAGIGA